MSSLITTTTECNVVPNVGIQMAVVVWVQFVMMGLQGWTLQSIAMWLELTSYRLEKAYHCKSTTRNQHEFIVYEFTNEHKNKLELRSDRSVGERKDGSPSFGPISTLSPWRSSSTPGPSSPLSSENERNSNVSCSPSDSSLSFPSDVSSNQHLAADTVVRIKGHPACSQILRTITFNGDRSLRPSLWDIMILVLVVHNDSAIYTLLTRQCYWFADTIFGSLEKWAANHNNGTVITGEKRRAKWGRRRASTGSRGIVTVYRRNAVHIDKIWADFEKERQVMAHQVSFLFPNSADDADGVGFSGCWDHEWTTRNWASCLY